MPYLRARTTGWHGRKSAPPDEATQKAAARAAARLPPPGRTCPTCGTGLSRYTEGPECRTCKRRPKETPR